MSRSTFDAIVGERNARGAPDLAIEVLSPSTRRRDEILKRRLYERTGVGEYWTVDPKIEAVKVYRALGGRLAKGAEPRSSRTTSWCRRSSPSSRCRWRKSSVCPTPGADSATKARG